MPPQKSMLQEFPWDQRYSVPAIEDLLTPALLMYPDIIAANIDRTLKLLDGNADRWRVHIKTAKLARTLRMLIDRGVRNFKCATTLELLVACKNGAADVLFAYPAMGANARRVQEIAQQFPNVRISVLAESKEQAEQWRGGSVGIFIDINPGMNRTGVEQSETKRIVSLARAITDAGLDFRGLHYYDGQLGNLSEPERTQAAHRGYDHLLTIVSELESAGIHAPEVITSGTPTFPCALAYVGFRRANFVHRVSPGTIVYCDATSLQQLPREYGYQPAALVLTRVVSHPHAGVVTCDAGHKAVSADAGVPTCVVLGHPELTPLAPSEEHLPIAVKEGTLAPQRGDVLHLLPRHICPTVNNFDVALLIRNGRVESLENVTARGHESPLLQISDRAPSLSS
jgi:D-serine deaminase-like pyridoxal phosphate-dependent protein